MTAMEDGIGLFLLLAAVAFISLSLISLWLLISCKSSIGLWTWNGGHGGMA